MKRRIIVGVISGAVLMATLLLTGCKPTQGSGAFTSGDEDYVKFSVSAEASGSRYSRPVADGILNDVNMQYIFFQPAQGYFSFSNNATGDVTKITGNFNGTFVLTEDLADIFLDGPPEMALIPPGAKISAFVGNCMVNSENTTLNGKHYLLAIFMDDVYIDPDYPDFIAVAVFEEPLFVRGRLTDAEQTEPSYAGPVVAGNVYIGQNSQGQNRNGQN